MFGRNCRASDLPSALRSPGSKIAGYIGHFENSTPKTENFKAWA